MNCKNLILAIFKDLKLSGKESAYLKEAQLSFQALNKEGDHVCKIVEWKDFVSQVLAHPDNLGICFGKSGVEESIALNQTKGLRAALTHTAYIAKMCREHNDANVVILPMDCIGDKLAGSLVLEYLGSGFDGQEKNRLRINKMMEFQKAQ